MKIVPLADVSAAEWEGFVDSCDECWLYHHPVFLDLQSGDSRSFALLDDRKIVGGCILYVTRSGLGNVLAGRYGPAGLALAPKAARRAYPLVREYLVSTARKSACHAIQMGLPALAPAFAAVDYLDSHLYHLGFNNMLRWGTLTHYTPSYATIIDLRAALEEVWAGFSELARRKCRKASRAAFSSDFFQGNVPEQAWNAFLQNHEITMRQSGAAPLPPSLLGRLRSFVERNYAALIQLSVGTSVVASLLLLTYKNSAFCFASGLQREAYKDGFAAQLHWTAVHELKLRGFADYEVGQFFPALKGTKLNRIGEFKRMFGGRKKSVLAGELVTNELRFLCLHLLPAYASRWLVGMRDFARGRE